MSHKLNGFDAEVELTTDHPASHYGQPVLLINGEPYGIEDVTPAGDKVWRMLEDWAQSAEPGAARDDVLTWISAFVR